ncbi:MAG: transcriptional regulator [Herpetosiphonaceae bacterium]|nr:MAG: transcriptional regulator [Herpetosiphonaceae bacterium]
MHKTELTKKVAEKAGVSQRDAAKVIEAMQETIEEALRNGEKVVLTGFGTFEMRQRRERQGINPKTREPMTIAATRTPGFSASSALKRAVGATEAGREAGS